MTRELVDRPELAIENILRYQTELRDDARLAGLMKSAHTWFAARSDDGAWLFAPSKFVGYAANTANDYLAGRGERDGCDTERVLRRWFALVPPETALTAELGASLARFVGGYGHSGPRKGARICVLKEVLASGEDAALSKPRERILVDPAICGGRPHIRGTRVRVSDILDMLAAGATPSEILADYPYLGEADLRAALAWGAAASEHRIIRAVRPCGFRSTRNCPRA